MKTLKLLFVFAVIGAAAYLAVLVVPVYWSYYQFQDAIDSEARIQTYTQKSELDIRETMWKKAQQLDLPLPNAEAIKVERGPNGVAISTAYSVHFDVPVHPFDLNFQPQSSNKKAF
jgi:hypothetical protein